MATWQRSMTTLLMNLMDALLLTTVLLLLLQREPQVKVKMLDAAIGDCIHFDK